MKDLKFAAAALLLLLASGVAMADSTDDDANPSTSKIKGIEKGVNNSPKREDIDSEITNARLRASTGAKSLISLQSAFNYNGSSIQEPLAADRPVLSPGQVENDPAKLSGSISAKYRATDHDNVNLGIGVGWLTPTYQGQHGQIEDPYAGYSRLFKMGSVQNVFETVLTKYTAQSQIARKDNFSFDVDHTFLASVGQTKLQLGLNLAYTHEFYTDQVGTGQGAQEDEYAIFPFLEYAFTDRYSLRTVYRGLTYYNTLASTTTFTQDAITQSLGLGVSVTRDIYLYPNLQWVWTDVRPEKTNVALSANINL